MPRFEGTVDPDELATVCGRLDNLPLAIELAAPWVRALSLRQILSGLDTSLELLVGGPPGATPRHRTLMASMRWSHDRLTETEQRLFRRLAISAEPFTLEAAGVITQTVMNARPSPAGWPA